MCPALACDTGSSNSLLQQQQAGGSGKKKKQKTALGASEVVAAAAGSELLELLLLPGGRGLLAATGDARLLFFHPKVGRVWSGWRHGVWERWVGLHGRGTAVKPGMVATTRGGEELQGRKIRGYRVVNGW